MNNQQREAEAKNSEDPELSKLEEQLRETAIASNFFDMPEGKLFTKMATIIVQRNTKDILSDKFVDNHTGYLNAKAEANAISNLLRRMQVAASPVRAAKLQEKIDERK